MENITENKYTKDEINMLFKDELRTHYMKREGSIGTNIREYNSNNDEDINYKNKEDLNENKISKIKYKLMLKVVGSLFIGVLIMGYKTTQNDKVKNNTIVNWIKEEYKRDIKREEILENIEDISRKAYSKVNFLIPEDLYNKVVNVYVNKVKPEIMDFNIKNVFENTIIDNSIAVYNEDDIDIDTSNIVIAEEAVETSSQISLMDMDKEEILAKNINICLPVNGTITSIYGAREEVFKNVGYHTGIDIANVLNTPISSATDGEVVLTQEMDQYYGNNIEIEKDGVRFKYAHLNKINVNVGDKVSQGDIIGLMGSTGASTGSHLHFEIKINGRTVDPELILKFR